MEGNRKLLISISDISFQEFSPLWEVGANVVCTENNAEIVHFRGRGRKEKERKPNGRP